MELEKIETTELKEIATEYNVDIAKAEETTLGLKPTIDARALLIEEFETVSKLEINLENLPTFKELRLKFVKNRTQGIGNWHKVAKEVPLRMSQLIDAVKRNEIHINETHEQFLEKAEKHFEIQEQKRLEALQIERVKEISKYIDIEYIDNDLCNMNDMVWDAYLQGTKLNYDNKIAAEKKIELERLETERISNLHNERKESILHLWSYVDHNLSEKNFGEYSDTAWQAIINQLNTADKAEKERQEKISKDNKRLQKEAQDKIKKEEKERKALKEKQESDREKRRLLAIDFLLENGFKNTHGGMDKKDYFIGALHYSELDTDKELESWKSEVSSSLEKSKLLSDLKAKEDAERLEKQRLLDIEQTKIKAEKAASLAPDKTKLLELSKRIMSIDMPVLKAKEANDIMLSVVVVLSKIDSYITEKVESL